MSGCDVCEAVGRLDEDSVVYERDGWTGYQLAEVPGWIMLATLEHAESMGVLTDEQAAGFGRAVRALTAGIETATGCERVHVVYLGESARHPHAGLFPRASGEPAVFANDGVVEGIASRADAAGAAALRDTIRAALLS